MQPEIVTFPVGYLPADKIRNILGVSRLTSFDVYPTVNTSYLKHTKSWPYKGSYRTYPKHHNNAYIQSYAELEPNKITIYGAHRETITRNAPAGMVFAKDSNGVKIVRQSDGMEYHPTLNEWYGPKFATTIRENLTKNYLARRKAKREEKERVKANRFNLRERARLDKIFIANLHTTRVTLDDSCRAGNCVEGSLRFAERHLKVSREEIINNGHLFSVAANKLLGAKESQDRVNAAVRIAFARETLVQI